MTPHVNRRGSINKRAQRQLRFSWWHLGQHLRGRGTCHEVRGRRGASPPFAGPYAADRFGVAHAPCCGHAVAAHRGSLRSASAAGGRSVQRSPGSQPAPAGPARPVQGRRPCRPPRQCGRQRRTAWPRGAESSYGARRAKFRWSILPSAQHWGNARGRDNQPPRSAAIRSHQRGGLGKGGLLRPVVNRSREASTRWSPSSRRHRAGRYLSATGK